MNIEELERRVARLEKETGLARSEDERGESFVCPSCGGSQSENFPRCGLCNGGGEVTRSRLETYHSPLFEKAARVWEELGMPEFQVAGYLDGDYTSWSVSRLLQLTAQRLRDHGQPPLPLPERPAEAEDELPFRVGDIAVRRGSTLAFVVLRCEEDHLVLASSHSDDEREVHVAPEAWDDWRVIDRPPAPGTLNDAAALRRRLMELRCAVSCRSELLASHLTEFIDEFLRPDATILGVARAYEAFLRWDNSRPPF
jgi:hypothetical protein